MAAVKLLDECREEVILPLLNGKPLTLDIEGLEIMNDDPSEKENQVRHAKAPLFQAAWTFCTLKSSPPMIATVCKASVML